MNLKFINIIPQSTSTSTTMSSKKTERKLSCPLCGSERLNRVDELNPDYVCRDCGEILFGLTPETPKKTSKQKKELSFTILAEEESAVVPDPTK